MFVLDESRAVRYRGRIDDQYAIGARRAEPTRRDLAVALKELLAGRDVSVPLTPSSGCRIGRAPMNSGMHSLSSARAARVDPASPITDPLAKLIMSIRA